MNNIRALREKFGFSVRDLGTKLNINYGSISRMENGIQQIGAENAIAFANFFEVSVDFILGREWHDPERTIIKTVDFEFNDILRKLRSYTNNELMKLSGAIDLIVEERKDRC